MHLANAYYGHAHILRRYVGAPDSRPLAGMLQHGWNEGTGFTPHDPPRPVRRVLPCFVWNGENLERARAAGFGAVSAVGAPFLYLDRLAPAAGTTPTGDAIAYPFHAWEREGATGGTHVDYARALADREGPTTVCLYWLEYDRPPVREAYEELGHRVVCHGHREDPAFLENQLRELRAHRRMVSNRVSSALWYAGALGLEVELYGPEMGIGDEGARRRAYDRHRGRWPALFEGAVTGGAAREMALDQLGGGFLRSPSELGELLGLAGGPRAALAGLAPFTRTLMRLKRRLEGW